MKHTKGEWKVQGNQYGEYYIAAEQHGVPIGMPIALVLLQVEKTTKANAHLIASAPDLYEAVKYVLEIYDNLYSAPNLREVLNKAIAKAEGDN